MIDDILWAVVSFIIAWSIVIIPAVVIIYLIVKRKWKILFTVIAVIFGLILLCIIAMILICKPRPFNVNFATEVYIYCNYGDSDYGKGRDVIDCKITDQNDIDELKRILDNKWTDNSVPGCGWHDGVYVKFTDGKKTIKLYPGVDGCGTLSMNVNSDLSIRNFSIKREDQKIFKEIMTKYGMEFPMERWDYNLDDLEE